MTSVSEDNLPLVIILLLPSCSFIFLLRLPVFWLLTPPPPQDHSCLIPFQPLILLSFLFILPPHPLKDFEIWINLCLLNIGLFSFYTILLLYILPWILLSYCLSYKPGNSQTQNHHTILNHFGFENVCIFIPSCLLLCCSLEYLSSQHSPIHPLRFSLNIIYTA